MQGLPVVSMMGSKYSQACQYRSDDTASFTCQVHVKVLVNVRVNEQSWIAVGQCVLLARLHHEYQQGLASAGTCPAYAFVVTPKSEACHGAGPLRFD